LLGAEIGDRVSLNIESKTMVEIVKIEYRHPADGN
jgi:transcription elongation GreA/GreB family factor